MKKTKAELRENLDWLGLEWYRCPPEDDAVRKSLEWKIFEDVYALFQPPESHPDFQKITEAISKMYLEDMRRFDPSQNVSLSAFFGGRLKLRGIDIEREDKGLKPEKAEDPVTGTKKAVRVDKNVQSEEVWQTLSVPDTTEDLVNVDAIACKLVSAMLDLPNRLEGRKNNPVRRNYFRLFFTDGVADGICSNETADAFRSQERDLFQVIKTPFLDYFMARECRNVDEIKMTGLKPYGQMVPGRPMDQEPKQPLPLDVYTAYLRQIEMYKADQQAVSMQRTAYYKFLRSCLT